MTTLSVFLAAATHVTLAADFSDANGSHFVVNISGDARVGRGAG